MKQRVPPPILLAKTLELAAMVKRENREPAMIPMAATFYGPSFDPDTDYGPVSGSMQREQRTDECGVPVWYVRDPETGKMYPEVVA